MSAPPYGPLIFLISQCYNLSLPYQLLSLLSSIFPFPSEGVVGIMKSSLHSPGDLSLRGQLEDSALFALKVARSPQLYLDASRTYFFSITFISLILSKSFHLCVHLTSLAVPSLLPWGPTFFLVDILLIPVSYTHLTLPTICSV